MPLATVLTSLVTRALTPPGDSEPLPPALKAALETLLPLRALPAMLAKPEGLKQALQQSGLFLESQLIRGAPPPEGDLKAALTAVRQTADAARHTRGHEQGPMAEMGRLAEGGTERIKLMQLASLPAPAEWHRSEDNSQGFRLTLSVPLAPQGHERPQTAMMGVMIEHQPQPMPEPEDATARESQGEAQPFPWKVRIALDLEETGPVEAEIGLRGQSVSVQLWAEQPAWRSLPVPPSATFMRRSAMPLSRLSNWMCMTASNAPAGSAEPIPGSSHMSPKALPRPSLETISNASEGVGSTRQKTSERVAVALKYDFGDGAPIVTAKGRGEIAEKILETAREHDVAIEQNPVLAEALSRSSWMRKSPCRFTRPSPK